MQILSIWATSIYNNVGFLDFFSFFWPSVYLCVSQSVWLYVFTIHLKFLKTHNYWLAQLVYISFEFRARIKMHIKMFRNFSKKSGERYWFQDLGQNSLFSNSQHVLILLDLCVVWCGSVKCSFSVCSVISLFSCLAVNNCIGNMLDFPEVLHAARSFLNQSDCRTFQTSILKKQATLNSISNWAFTPLKYFDSV